MIKPLLLFVMCLSLVACVLSPPRINVPSAERDSAPLNPRDVSNVPNAVPKPVHRTIAGNKSPYTVLGQTYTLLPESRGYKERGIASWYGQKFHGRRTSNGEVYDMFTMTAAHKTLPIPSYVKVTNIDNGLSIVVRVNDRGPFHEGRIIDLSYAGAVKLGFLNRGTARVEVEDITPQVTTNLPYLRATPPVAIVTVESPKAAVANDAAAVRFLQLGAFSVRAGAERLAEKIANLFTLPVKVSRGTDQLHRVLMGPLNEEFAETEIQRTLLESGFDAGHFVTLP